MIKSQLMNIEFQRWTLLPALLIELFSILLFGCQPFLHAYHGSPYARPKEASNFLLTQTNGEVMSFPSDFHGIS
jgi:hypothetical protein